jgi:hypothetical protein
MLAMSIIALISTAGIAFYAIFSRVVQRTQVTAAYLRLLCSTRLSDEAKAIDPTSEPITTRIVNRRNNERMSK